MPPIQVFLGPLLGFLFTTGTLLFVALNAHRTVPTELAVAAAEPASEPASEAAPAATEAAPSAPETPGDAT
jgi:hypothetical protein